MLLKEIDVANRVCFKVIGQDYTKPDDIKFSVKNIKTDEVNQISVKDLFYQDKWLRGFSLNDVRMIAKVHTQSEWYCDKAQLAKNNKTAKDGE
jgi:hypothetical protein